MRPSRQNGTTLYLAVLVVAAATFWRTLVTGSAQEREPPTLHVGPLPENIVIDGVLNEPAWGLAESVDAFTQSDPAEGAPPSGRTVVRVLADRRTLAIGILCEDPDPRGIVSFSVRR